MKDCKLIAAILLALTGAGALALSQNLPSTLPSKSGQRYISAPPLGYGWLFQIGGKRYKTTISHDEVKAGRAWNPSMPLPLSFAKAEEIARAELKKLVGDGDTASWEITELQLKRMPANELQLIRLPGNDEPRWFFLIGMKPTPADQPPSQLKLEHDSFFVVMNLSGVVGKIEEDK